jgi:hypothetical protein
MYTEQEVTNIELNKQEQIFSIIGIANLLSKNYKTVITKFSDHNLGLKMAEEIIVRGYCIIYMAHMDESDFEEMLTNTLAYFATGLYDCEKITGIGLNHHIYPVSAWRYTPETHNNAGYWFDICTFEKQQDAEKCVAMLKAIGAELEKLHNN